MQMPHPKNLPNADPTRDRRIASERSMIDDRLWIVDLFYFYLCTIMLVEKYIKYVSDGALSEL